MSLLRRGCLVGLLTLLFLTGPGTRETAKIANSNSRYRERYNRIKNTAYSNMLHRCFVDKAEFINVTTALLTQRCTLCLLQLEHVPMQTCNSCSPSKSLNVHCADSFVPQGQTS